MHKSKICIRCGEEKPLDDFYIHKRMADGHLNVCKSCVKLRMEKYRKENIEKIREYDVKRSKTEKRKKLRKSRTLRKNHEVENYQRCHNAIMRAVKSGKIVRPEYCEVCSKKCRTEAHHKSYDESLRVVWMCRTCHANYHTGKSEQAELTRKIVDSMFEKMIS